MRFGLIWFSELVSNFDVAVIVEMDVSGFEIAGFDFIGFEFAAGVNQSEKQIPYLHHDPGTSVYENF